VDLLCTLGAPPIIFRSGWPELECLHSVDAPSQVLSLEAGSRIATMQRVLHTLFDGGEAQ
jgi:hypothetical protein